MFDCLLYLTGRQLDGGQSGSKGAYSFQLLVTLIISYCIICIIINAHMQPADWRFHGAVEREWWKHSLSSV